MCNYCFYNFEKQFSMDSKTTFENFVIVNKPHCKVIKKNSNVTNLSTSFHLWSMPRFARTTTLVRFIQIAHHLHLATHLVARHEVILHLLPMLHNFM
jgi:hypothetical protein